MYVADSAGRYYGDEGIVGFVLRYVIEYWQTDGETHVLDGVRQFLRRRLARPVLDIAGHLLQDYPDTDDIRSLADHPLDVPYATLTGHSLDTDFNRADFVRGMLARHAHQMRRTLVIGVIIAIPSNIFTDNSGICSIASNISIKTENVFDLNITFMTRCISQLKFDAI